MHRHDDDQNHLEGRIRKMTRAAGAARQAQSKHKALVEGQDRDGTESHFNSKDSGAVSSPQGCYFPRESTYQPYSSKLFLVS